MQFYGATEDYIACVPAARWHPLQLPWNAVIVKKRPWCHYHQLALVLSAIARMSQHNEYIHSVMS